MSKSRLEGSHIKSRKTVVEIGPTQSKSAVYKKKNWTDKLKKWTSKCNDCCYRDRVYKVRSCFKIYGKCKIFLMAVYMIFKYSKRFRFAPLFNDRMHRWIFIIFQQILDLQNYLKTKTLKTGSAENFVYTKN